MGKHTRVTALVLVAALILNMVSLPVYAENSVTGSFSTQNTEISSVSEVNTSSSADNLIGGGGIQDEESESSTAEEASSDENDESSGSDENTGSEAETPSEGSESSPGSAESIGSESGNTSEGAGNTPDSSGNISSTTETTDEGSDDKVTPTVSTFNLSAVQASVVADTRQNFTLAQVGLKVTEADNSIKIQSGEDLIRLSHVKPADYSGKRLYIVSTASSGFDTTQAKDIEIKLTDAQTETYSLSFVGLDFINGTVFVESGSENHPIKLKRPLFNTLSDQVVIGFGAAVAANANPGLTLMYEAKTGETVDSNIPSALLAKKVVNTEAFADTAEYRALFSDVDVLSEDDSDNTVEDISEENTSNNTEAGANNIWNIRPIASDSNGRMPTLIGTLDNNAKVTLSIDLPVGDNQNSFGVTLVKEESGSGSGVGSGAGLLCAVMNSGSVLTLESLYRYGSSMPSVSATGSAGALVGTMNAGSSLVLADSTFVLSDITSIAGDAGGLVGAVIDAGISAKDQNTISISSDNQKTISGLNAGGLAGSCTYKLGEEESTAKRISLSNIRISEITLTGKGSNQNGNAGGVFGILNTTGKGTVVFENSISTDVTLTANNNAGGLIGQYSANDLDGTLRLDSGSVASVLNGNTTTSSYGGLIGYVKGGNNDGPSYIEVNIDNSDSNTGTDDSGSTLAVEESLNVDNTITVSGTATNYGGLIGSLSDHGHFLKVGAVNITAAGSAKGNSYAGGLIGKFDSGILWLAAAVSAVRPECGNNKNKGNYVGYRGNTLVFTSYTPDGGWNFNNGWNDIGNWGQVLQASALSGLLDLSENHKVIVIGTSDDDNAIVSFARIALKTQLESKGALEISNDFASNSINILLPEGRIDLSGTGLTGIQRDYRSAEIIDVSISCSDTTEIVFPDITIYGGQDVHDRQGLFSRTGSLTVNGEGSNKDLTLSGSISVSAIDKNVYIGSLTAESCGSVTANRVISNTSLSIVNANSEERVAGLVAHQNSGSGSTVLSVDLDECKLGNNFSINYDGSNVCFLGGLIARIENGCNVSIKNCSITGSITKTGSGECYVGGLIASLRDKEDTTLGNKLTINGLTADGVTINTENATNSGGILGWEWMTDTADIQGVTIKNCTLKAGSARFGGLVFKGNGYWSVHGVHGSGIKFVSGNSFTGGSSDSGVSGLFLADGTKGSGHKNALYLEIQSGAYTIEDNSVSLDLTDGNGQSAVFDEIIGTTEYTDERGNTINAGIVSIGTGINEALPKASDCSYTKKFPEYHNSKTRYYYNLDVFRADQASGSEGTSLMAAASGDINAPAEMVLYSAYTHCYSGIKDYFYSNPGKITGTLDLTGYSYYPAEVDATIENAAVTFDYKGLEGNMLKPSAAADQNYGMHTGIFTEVAVASDALAPKTLNVSSLTLSGTVGNYGTDESGTAGISGALIRGDAHGGNTNAKLTLDINGVTLDNLFVYPRVDANNVAPILINSIGSYTNLNISGVEMNGYTYGTGASGNLTIGSGYYAASSLIGNVGSENASHIKLDFSAMVLDGYPDRTIFSRALFLESFMYSGDSSGVYNFMSTESNYTLGQELSNTERSGDESGPSGRNNGLQYHFFDVSTNVCTVVGGAAADPESFFNSYTRYVFHNEEGYHHELDINLSRSGLTKGCGTINDPYIIESAIQLRELASAVSGTVLKGMQIQVDTGILNGSTMNSFSSSHAAEELNTHKIYTGVSSGDSSAWKYSDSDSITNENMFLYLRNAYYRIDKNIEMSGEWTGLGASDKSAFCGVIDGNGNKIIINSASGNQFGGIIKFSMGSVVKDLTVQYTATPSVTSDYVPNSTSNASFFGGIVGWCLGGDTILQNVSVTGPNDSGLSVPNVSGTYHHLAAIGGYVGMAGGALINGTLEYGGGVVFRGDVGTGLNGGNASSDSKYFYVNPYVGRVLDGYALSETASLNNTDKNYSIPLISAGKHIGCSGNVITINDAQGLWLLSAIANSGAGAIQYDNGKTGTQNISCRAYTYGKIRTGSYTALNKETIGSDEDYIGGKQYTNKEISYLSRYAEGSIYNICSANISISLASDCDMTAYGNGFRGIGTSYGTNANTNVSYRLIKTTAVASSVSGTSRIITLSQNRNEYLEEKDNWTSIGTGMFVLMGVPSGGSLTVSDLTFKGKTGIVYYKIDSSSNVKAADVSDLNLGKKKTGTSNGERLTLVGAGMLTGNFAKIVDNYTISKVTCSNVHVSGMESSKVYINKDSQGTTFAGGLIGALWNNGTITDVEFINCSAKYAEVCGRLDTGGLLGLIKSTNASVTASASDSTSEAPNGYMILQNVNAVSTQLLKTDMTGVGGLIGYSENCTLKIGNGIPLSIYNIGVSSKHVKTENDYFNTGGIVGAWVVTTDKDAGYAKNINMQGRIVISGAGNNQSVSSVGAITGTVYDSYIKNGFEQTDKWGSDSKKLHLELSDILIATDENATMTICNGRQIGGLIGMLKGGHLSEYNTVKYNETVKIENIRIGHAPSSDGVYNVKLISNSEPDKKDCSVGGIIGTVCINPIIVMNNIELNGMVSMTHGESSSSAALLIAFTECHSGTAKFRFSNVTANKCAAVGDHDNVNAAMIVGRFIDKNKHEVTGNNILFNDCKVGLSLTSNGNQLVLKKLNNSDSVPELDAVGIGNKVGSNYISYNNISVDQQKSINNANMGALFGTVSTNRKIQIAGISVQNSSAPLRDYGKNSPNSASYIIHADYTGDSLKESNTGSGNTNFVTASQFVTVKPVSPLVISGSTITGDGAVFSTKEGEEMTPLLNTILDNSDGRYYNINSYSKVFLDKEIKENKVELSHFRNTELNTFTESDNGTVSEPSVLPADFPVVVLQTNSSNEADSCMHSIISVLTNMELCTDSNGTVTTGTKGFQSLTATSYRWDNNRFVSQETNPSLFVQDNRFYIKPGGYDNKLKQFTLVDVAYKDPNNLSSKDNIFHLYIPVVVKKMFDYKFWASAKLGTTYSTDQYNSLSQPVIASNGEAVTALLTYEYQWTENEWKDAMENGQSLLWNFDLGVVFDPYDIPDKTKMILVDRNHKDRAYYATKTGEMKNISFKQFKTVPGGTSGWDSDRYLCDDLKLTASPNAEGKYYQIGNTKTLDATLRAVDGYYYRPAVSTDVDSSKRYDLSIGALDTNADSDDKVTAQFYLTLHTPGSVSESIINTNIQCADTLSGNLPSRRLPAADSDGTSKHEYSINDSENKIILGDFFTQTTSVITTRGEEKMTEMSEDIPLVLTSVISFRDGTVGEQYKAYASNQRLYQRFELKLKEYKNGSPGQKDLVQGTYIKVQYYLGDDPVGEPVTELLAGPEDSYMIEYLWTDGEPGIPAGSFDTDKAMELKAKVTLTYLPAVRNEQFPTRSSEGSSDGIAVAVNSVLAYNLDSLRSRHNQGQEYEAKYGETTPHFYREDTGAASLYYAAYEDTDTVPAESVSRLGINGRDGSLFQIDSMAIYNVSEVKEADAADRLKVTVTLLEKQKDSKYNSLVYSDVNASDQTGDLSKYLDSVTATANYKGQTDMKEAQPVPDPVIDKSSKSFIFSIPEYDPTVPIQIPVKLNVKTGDGFDGSYANYRVKVTAELMKHNESTGTDDQINNSLATDYIVYTNAMISRSFIDIDQSS